VGNACWGNGNCNNRSEESGGGGDGVLGKIFKRRKEAERGKKGKGNSDREQGPFTGGSHTKGYLGLPGMGGGSVRKKRRSFGSHDRLPKKLRWEREGPRRDHHLSKVDTRGAKRVIRKGLLSLNCLFMQRQATKM